jgi:hypothetical protein
MAHKINFLRTSNKARVARIALIIGAMACFILLVITIKLTNSGQSNEAARRESPTTSHRNSHGDWQVQLLKVAAAEAKATPQSGWPFSELPSSRKSMPFSLRRRVISNLGGRQKLGLRFDRAIYVPTRVGGGIWISRGKQVACIFQAVKAAASCASNVEAGKHGVQLVVGVGAIKSRRELPNHFLAVGIVPDGIRAVRLKPAGSKPRLVKVIHNAFSMLAGSPIYFDGVIY